MAMIRNKMLLAHNACLVAFVLACTTDASLAECEARNNEGEARDEGKARDTSAVRGSRFALDASHL